MDLRFLFQSGEQPPAGTLAIASRPATEARQSVHATSTRASYEWVRLYPYLHAGRRRIPIAHPVARPATPQIAQWMEVQALGREVLGILQLHRGVFMPAQRPVAPSPIKPGWQQIYTYCVEPVLAHISAFGIGERVKAKRTSRRSAQVALQRELDARWARLCANDPTVVLATLREAFEDTNWPAAPVAMRKSAVGLIVVVPDLGVVPDRQPAVTPHGRATFRQTTKAEQAMFYNTLVCGHLLVAVREALAVAPGVTQVSVAAVRAGGYTAYGQRRVSLLVAASFDRRTLDAVAWDVAEAVDIVNEASSELLTSQEQRHGPLKTIQTVNQANVSALVNGIRRRVYGVTD